jgi:hypothetical protein
MKRSTGDAASPDGRRVSGTVIHADGSPIGRLRVQAFHRRVGSELPLGAGVSTNERGLYAIAYQTPPGTSKIDLFVRAYDDRQSVVAVSPILIGAGEKATLNLTVANAHLRGSSEFAKVTDALRPHLTGVDLVDVDANDVALLVRNTGVGREPVTAWIAAKRLADRTSVAHEPLYALVRSENTASLSVLLQRSSGRLRQSIEGAADQNVISHAAGKAAQTTVGRLRQLSVELSASSQTPDSLGRLLATATTATSSQQSRFIERYAKHKGPIQGLWAALRKDPEFGDDVVADLQLSLQLGALSVNHPPLVDALRTSGIDHAAQLARLGDDDWKALFDTEIGGQAVGTPTGIRGATDAQRRDNYIRVIQERIARAFPTAHVSRALKAVPEWQASTAVAFLDANPDFDVLSANIARSLSAADAVLDPAWDRASLESELSTAQRVARMAPRGQEEVVVKALIGNGYASALSVARQSRASFRRKAAGSLGGAATADAVHRAAQFQVARAGTAYALMHPSLGGGVIDAVGKVSRKVASDATWASLFGNVDYCDCQHCRSIYSPAAYLVDLLAWLDGHEVDGKTAFDRLKGRRPDIQRLELSCENTNTVLPYVDLTNEILEVSVLNPPGRPSSTTEAPIASTGTSPELLANPEYLNARAYDEHLAKAVFPDVLPFDLWGALRHVYFEHLGVRRSDLMEALRRRNTPSNDAINAERLQLSTAQWPILTNAARHDVWEYWGYQSAKPGGADFKKDLAVVSNFVRRAGIEYDELLDLLHSRFGNASGLRLSGAECNTDEMTIGPLRGRKGDAALGSMHRFLRLWRNRGWSMLDLDKALHALGLTTLDGKGLGRLADLDRVQAIAGAPLLEVLSWWAPLDTFGDRPEKESPVKSLYDRVFLNRAVDAAADQPGFPLALNAHRDGLAHTVPWDEVRSMLQAALSIDADDLALLLDASGDAVAAPQRVVTGDTASLEGLSALYRHVTLARRLKLTIGELLGFVRLIGRSPFDVTDMRATIDCFEALSAVRAAGFSLQECLYLLEHDASADASVGVTDDAIGQVLVEMRDGLARVAADYTAAADPVGEITERYLAELLDADDAADVMTALGTEADAVNHGDLEAALTEPLGPILSVDAEALIALPVADRFSQLSERLATHLREAHSDSVIIEKIATFAGRDLESVQDLLSLRLRMTIDGVAEPALSALRTCAYTATSGTEILPAEDAEAFAALRRAHKAALVLNRLDIDVDLQTWLFDVGVHNGLLDPSGLPVTPQAAHAGAWEAWLRLLDVAALQKDLPGGEPALVGLLRMLEDAAVTEGAFFAELTTRTGWLLADLETVTGALGAPYPAGWRDGTMLRRLVDAFTLIGRLGVSAGQADAWATAPIDAAQAEALRLAAKAKHDDERWPAIARALRDPVREKQRVALVAYLIARDEEYADEEDLFADLLIDVEMAPCMLTSRIKQAISSVQLFVQRSFLNLEDGVELTRDDAEQWKWMKTYRVWEAARKVFLYPENWVEPELRPDKSPLFEQLENALMQGELDDVAAEKAYTAYLEGLLKVARLEVMGLCHQFEEDDDGIVDALHVVARTRSQPHEYYYRQRIDEREWTTWEHLDGEIEGNHVTLAVCQRRLFVIWPVVVQKARPIPSTDPGIAPTQHDYYEIKLAWMERMNGQWGARKLSTEYITVDDATWTEQASGFYLRTIPGDALVVECLYNIGWRTSSERLGTFTLDACTGHFVAEASGQEVDEHVPIESGLDNMRIRSSAVPITELETFRPAQLWIGSAQIDSDGRVVSDPDDVHVLSHVEGSIASFRYLYPTQYGLFLSQHGVFLDDDERTFHVMPERVVDLDGLYDMDSIDPSVVGTAYSELDVFERPQPRPAFEPDLDWSHGFATAIKATGAQNRAAGVSVAGALTIDTAATGALTNAGLQSSQLQLDETTQVVDAMTRPAVSKYRFSLFHHPYVCDFMTELRRFGVTGLLDPNPEGSEPGLVRQAKSRPAFFAQDYDPTDAVLTPYPIQDIDFEPGGAYAKYNWEIFFHAPMLIASRLSRNQRFDEARRWFHFMFDPTNRSNDRDPLRYWKIKPFYREPDEPIAEFLALAASTSSSPEVEEARAAYDRQVDAWLDDPFSPHEIAELRTTAYQKALVMKYLDNLIAWGDQLFRQDTIETVNEATQLYVLALQLLGERPDAIPPRSVPVPTTFERVRADLTASVLNDPMVSVSPLVRLENLIPAPHAGVTSTSPIAMAATGWAGLFVPRPPVKTPQTSSARQGFYFCIPPNETLLSYWDTVEDRLFKIRHCMNIEGVVRQLPLFEPPIDPGMLVRARAAGIDLSSALADLSAPLPHYRFSVVVQKTYALNQTVRGLGAALLSALEKADAEALANLRANQEVAVLEAVRAVKALAIDDARLALAAAERSLAVVEQRRDYYQRLTAAGLLPEEVLQAALMEAARKKQKSGSLAMTIAGAVANVPAIVTGASGVAASPVATSTIVSGLALAKGVELTGQALTIEAASKNAEASLAGIIGGFGRRQDEWQNQLELSRREIAQIGKQIDAARVRVSLAERDRDNHERQVENARAVREFMEQKFTSGELYHWMVGQLSTLYFQSYQLAYDHAKQAERAYRHELALPDATYIKFGYWDSLKKGLLAGERLQHDVERMDAAYLENNRREYEMTKHVSLALLDPVALVQLQTAGACEFSVPEAAFDVDCPGHYLRRIKSVSVTVPCVTGPYTSVPMRLTLVSSHTRVDPSAASAYPMNQSEGASDARFQMHTGAVQSIMVSNGREDAGVFTPDHRDERYLPFEGSGAISNWSLALTSAVPTFDWSSISDVVLHVKYTAREGGDALRSAALASLNNELSAMPLRRAFSARSEFPSEWSAFLRPAEGASQAVLRVAIDERRFPYLARDASLAITNLEVVAHVPSPEDWEPSEVTVATSTSSRTATLTSSPPLFGGQPSAGVAYANGAALGTWEVSVPVDRIGAPSDWAEDLILVATYKVTLAVGS